MSTKTLLSTVCLSVAMTIAAVPAVAAAPHACVAAQPTAASSTWNFHQEANQLFTSVNDDAQRVLNSSAKLQAFANDSQIDWQTHADQLNKLEDAVNDIGARLCRLETIRTAVAPWQQRIIDRIAVNTRLMADNTQDAILFLNNHENDLWMPTYKKYADNLYNEAEQVTANTGNAVEYSHVRHEYRDLRHDLRLNTTTNNSMKKTS